MCISKIITKWSREEMEISYLHELVDRIRSEAKVVELEKELSELHMIIEGKKKELFDSPD